jgi:hypothetical protein
MVSLTGIGIPAIEDNTPISPDKTPEAKHLKLLVKPISSTFHSVNPLTLHSTSIHKKWAKVGSFTK